MRRRAAGRAWGAGRGLEPSARVADRPLASRPCRASFLPPAATHPPVAALPQRRAAGGGGRPTPRPPAPRRGASGVRSFGCLGRAWAGSWGRARTVAPVCARIARVGSVCVLCLVRARSSCTLHVDVSKLTGNDPVYSTDAPITLTHAYNGRDAATGALCQASHTRGTAPKGGLGAPGGRRRARRALRGPPSPGARLGRLLGLAGPCSAASAAPKPLSGLPPRGYTGQSNGDALEACGDGAGGGRHARRVIGRRARRDAARRRARRRACGWLRRVGRAQEGAGRGLDEVCGADAPGQRPISKETAIAGLGAGQQPVSRRR